MFQLNGAIYLVSTPVFEKGKVFIPSETYAYVMPRERSLDVDTPWDFHLVDLLLREKHVSRYA
jgi:CMP-N-acetylneuraminic acid synthetase